MRIEQRHWTEAAGWNPGLQQLDLAPQLVLVFGAREALARPDALAELARIYPDARIFGCSTSGEISGTRVFDDSIVATAIQLERSTLRSAHVRLESPDDSADAGRALASELSGDGLVHVLVLADGLRVNGTRLVQGLSEALPAHVTVSGGLAGDAARFQRTLVCVDGEAREGYVAAIGFYGAELRVGCGSLAGWDSFGPDRLVTRSAGKVLYELDGRPALELYKMYLGPYADGLPGSALHFPLTVRGETGDETGVVRTILAVDEREGSITLAGDVAEGSYARLMRANYDRLIDGASRAAVASHGGLGEAAPELAILFSCVGRKLVLGQRTEEEVEGVQEVLGGSTALTGFYSYGEISPFTSEGRCELHNQTMSITTLAER